MSAPQIVELVAVVFASALLGWATVASLLQDRRRQRRLVLAPRRPYRRPRHRVRS